MRKVGRRQNHYYNVIKSFGHLDVTRRAIAPHHQLNCDFTLANFVCEKLGFALWLLLLLLLCFMLVVSVYSLIEYFSAPTIQHIYPCLFVCLFFFPFIARDLIAFIFVSTKIHYNGRKKASKCECRRALSWGRITSEKKKWQWTAREEVGKRLKSNGNAENIRKWTMLPFYSLFSSISESRIRKVKEQENKINFSLLFKFLIANIRHDAIQFEAFDFCRGVESEKLNTRSVSKEYRKACEKKWT